MKYLIYKWFKKIFAALVAAIMSFTGSGSTTPAEKDRPDANTVTAYSTEASDYALNIDAGDEIHDISDLLFGIFFEDINFAADGGLYAEMVANRSFEYTELAVNDSLYAWSSVNGAELKVENSKSDSLNENNPSYLVLTNSSDSLAGISNRGFLDGMSVNADADYNFSVYAKGVDGYNGKLYVRLCVGDKTVGKSVIESVADEWTKYNLSLTCTETAHQNVTLQVLADKGTVALDMISLFPEDTFKGRENGMRKDLGEMLEALEPKFLRFPGGCIIEGNDYESAYNWK